MFSKIPKRFSTNFAHFDWTLFCLVIVLSLVGVVFSYSSQILIYEGKINPYNNYVKQTFYFISGLAVMLIVSFSSYRKVCENVYLIYGVSIASLMYTLIAGTIVNQSKRWISIGLVSVQPSEFAKIAVILLVAVSLEKMRGHGRYFSRIMLLAAMVAVPFVLIALQPDLGTALILLPLFAIMVAVLGVNFVTFASIATASTIFFVFIFLLIKADTVSDPSEFLQLISSVRNVSLFATGIALLALVIFAINLNFKNAFLQFLGLLLLMCCLGMLAAMFVDEIILKPYQKERLLAFVDPISHKKDLGYNVLQSQIAIGSGGFWGKGLFNGVQGQLGFLPSRTNDFIFSVVGEELGFFGIFSLMGLFMLLLYRIAKVGLQAKDYLGGLIVMGVFTMFAFQILTNIAMTVGMMPVTGIPLPFLSTGGSTLWTCLIAIGMVLSVSSRRHVN